LSFPGSLQGFATRIGSVLVAPREALARVADGEGGLSDVSWLLVARVVCGETPRLVKAFLGVKSLGPLAAIQGALGAASAILPDLLGILVGSVALALLRGLGLHGRDRAGEPWAKGRELDLAAVAWIPYLTVRVVSVLVFTALQRPPSTVEERVFDGLAVAWSVMIWTLALVMLREGPPPVSREESGPLRQEH
jgi:hypothetical protein